MSRVWETAISIKIVGAAVLFFELLSDRAYLALASFTPSLTQVREGVRQVVFENFKKIFGACVFVPSLILKKQGS